VRGQRIRAAFALVALALSLPLAAQDGAAVRIAIIIDDIGDSLADGRRAVALPAPVTCAILPHTAYARELAQAAHRAGKQVMLHLPMPPDGEVYDPGPGQIDADMGELEIGMMLAYNLETVPHAAGINNHMGSRLTTQPEPMARLMRALRARGGLFFVDSVTSAASVATDMARRHGVPALRRDVFLDNERNEAAVEQQLELLIHTARRRGRAIGIGHPYPETLAVLERRLPALAGQGVEIVAPSLLIPKTAPEDPLWPVSSSR
jgi:polysaccharide deacetylase 2 family uncharacterized protein YibQ